MGIKQRALDKLETSKIAKRFVRESRYRIVATAALSFSANLLYALYHGALGMANQSLWFISMCAYYTILSAMRFSAVLCGRKSNSAAPVGTEYFVMKLSGILLAVLSFVLTGAIYLSSSPLLATIRRIGYADAAVSVLILQRSMLASFGNINDFSARTMNILIGAAVCLFVWMLGVTSTRKGIKKKGV